MAGRGERLTSELKATDGGVAFDVLPKCRVASPVATFPKANAFSLSPAARVLPSGEKATEIIRSGWFRSCRVSPPLRASYKWTTGGPGIANSLPSGEKATHSPGRGRTFWRRICLPVATSHRPTHSPVFTSASCLPSGEKAKPPGMPGPSSICAAPCRWRNPQRMSGPLLR